MKSLLQAGLFFAVVVWGCYDVIPFKPLRGIARRARRLPTTPPAEPAGSYPDHTPPPRSRYR